MAMAQEAQAAAQESGLPPQEEEEEQMPAEIPEEGLQEGVTLAGEEEADQQIIQ